MRRIVGILVFGFAMMLGQLSFAASADRDMRSQSASSESRSESRSTRQEARNERVRERRAERRQLRREARDVRSVPELDGGFALLAFGLVAGVALIIRERRRK
ncbi:MAG: hypothetical protein RJQ07_11780 [Pseudomonadales bacterium]